MKSSTQGPIDQADWFVTSLDRGLRVLRVFDGSTPIMRVSEVAKRAEISRAAARRFLLTLESLGYVGCDAEQRYFLKPLTLALGYSYLSSIGIAELVQPILDATMAATDESCSMSILVGNEIVYLARAKPHRPLQIVIRPGDRLPASVTSMGRVLLSGLSEQDLNEYLETAELRAFTDYTITDPGLLRARIEAARNDGYALVDSELAIGIVSISVPVCGPQGDVLAALNIASQARRSRGTDQVFPHLSKLQSAADQVAKILASLPAGFFHS
ncbi:IclR family transcriptional regulator domain-containing protein [Vannielia litorea]|uniref:IclR family transcriptional regulator domain-containing protein n=1 Tax=Vannielia litorea TaxID=1217970 RepID=UPI001BCDE04F|nr:IclR family transcriptional regulator C-terminal domain-containing protein [Vannielia litorea]MBS8224688.1 IclR family transcriptional regulator [Vannielia litorea]